MADPLDALRLPATPVAPDPAFRTRLRARLEAALAPPPPDPDALPAITLRPEEATMATSADPTHHPEGVGSADAGSTAATTATQALTPYINVDDAAAALDWYRDVLGAIETNRFVMDDGRVGHAEVVIGGSTLMLADAYPEVGLSAPTPGSTSVSLHLEVVDVDHSYRLAVENGAVSEREPSDQFHGNRNAVVRDPFGHRWMLTQPITAERAEVAAEADAASGEWGDPRRYQVTGRQPNELGYVTMRTADLEKARAFFGALFSWQVEAGNVEGGGHIANTRLPMGFMESDDTEGSPVTLYVRVDDIEPFAAKVEELGGRVLNRTDYPSGGNAECVDDQGFRFDLFQPAPGY